MKTWQNGKFLGFVLVFLVALLSGVKTASASFDVSFDCTIYGKGCRSCFFEYAYSERAKLSTLGETNFSIVYIEDNESAAYDLDQIHLNLRVPANMRGNIVTIINGSFLFEGFVSVDIIEDFLKNHSNDYQQLVLYKDELRGLYVLMDESRSIKEGILTNSISECDGSPHFAASSPTLLLITVSGLLDGINPCAFAVLLFFLTVLYVAGRSATVGQTRKKVLTVGLAYITAVFVSYLLIGLAFIKVIAISPFPKLIGTIGICIMMLFGVLNLKDYFFYGKGPSLSIPITRWRTIAKWMHKATIPATVVAGFIVSVFEFPCTGGIYVGILGLLATETAMLEGFFYLVIYNLAFITPLLIILVFSSNKTVVEKLRVAQEKQKKRFKLFTGIVMLLFGVLLLYVTQVV